MIRLTTAVAMLGLVTGGALTGTAFADNAIGSHPRAVVELFTSQGCSSCPAADRLIGEYADRDDLLTLSFNVDVWDWIGWKDTLAHPDNTERQRAYAAAMGERGIYTPQVVVDGRTHMVGSDRRAIDNAIAGPDSALTIPLSLSMTDNSIAISVGATEEENPPHAVLWLVLFDREVTVLVERGENAGETLTYHNVVRKIRPIAMWKGAALNFEQSKNEIIHAGVDGCAFLLQVEGDDGSPGPVIGAVQLATNW